MEVFVDTFRARFSSRQIRLTSLRRAPPMAPLSLKSTSGTPMLPSWMPSEEVFGVLVACNHFVLWKFASFCAHHDLSGGAMTRVEAQCPLRNDTT